MTRVLSERLYFSVHSHVASVSDVTYNRSDFFSFITQMATALQSFDKVIGQSQ